MLNKKKGMKYNIIIIMLLFTLGCQTINPITSESLSNNDNFFKYNDTQIWYDDIGEGDTFLFIHGFAASSYTWR